MSQLVMLRLTAGRITSHTRLPATMRLRRLHNTPMLELPRKDSQDKDSIITEATEYSKSGSDDQTAEQEQAAFNPNETAPEKEKLTAGKGNKKSSNPLDVSPANLDISKPKLTPEGGAENSSSDRKQSRHGSPNKGKKP